ncbi:unnamed protein product [Orchesella dallaii]|uniref:Gustatory receptor n=1 Tax=Orchesella dallaii TaxID=48710 RepID=A0ABP1S3H4_9HEXA
MITDRVVALVGYRMYLINWGFCSVCEWNRETKKVTPSGTYRFMNWWLVIFGASVYTAAMTYRIYDATGVLFGEGREDEKLYNVSKSGKLVLLSLIVFTVDCLAWIFIFNIIGVGILVSEKRFEICNVINEIVRLNYLLLERVRNHNGYLPLEERRGRKLNAAEECLILLNVGTMLLPILYGFTILHPYEPVHRTLLEWFEVQPKPQLSLIPVIILVDWGLFYCANAVFIPIAMALLYIGFCRFWIPGIMPRSIVIYQGKPRYSTDVGLVDGEFIRQVYRIIQVLNISMNSILKTGWTCMHHATVLFVFVLSVLLCIRYNEDVQSMGVAGLVLPSAGIAVILVEYYECHLLGKILWESRLHISVGRKFFERRSVMKKFYLSCTDIRLYTAYPFFVVSYDTFLLVVNQGIDFLVSFLVFSA